MAQGRGPSSFCARECHTSKFFELQPRLLSRLDPVQPERVASLSKSCVSTSAKCMVHRGVSLSAIINPTLPTFLSLSYGISDASAKVLYSTTPPYPTYPSSVSLSSFRGKIVLHRYTLVMLPLPVTGSPPWRESVSM